MSNVFCSFHNRPYRNSEKNCKQDASKPEARAGSRSSENVNGVEGTSADATLDSEAEKGHENSPGHSTFLEVT